MIDCPGFMDMEGDENGGDDALCEWVNENDIFNTDCLDDCYGEYAGVALFLDLSCSYCLDDNNDCSWVDGDHIECEDNEFGCHDGSACIPSENKCDGVAHCVDGSDECHGGCDNLCDQYGDDHDDGDDGPPQCVLDSCLNVPDPAVQGGGAFCDWLNSGDASCLDGACTEDDDLEEIAYMQAACDYCTSTNVFEDACEVLFNEFDDSDDDECSNCHDDCSENGDTPECHAIIKFVKKHLTCILKHICTCAIITRSLHICNFLKIVILCTSTI
jgi:hypothetical protein